MTLSLNAITHVSQNGKFLQIKQKVMNCIQLYGRKSYTPYIIGVASHVLFQEAVLFSYNLFKESSKNIYIIKRPQMCGHSQGTLCEFHY